MAKTAKAPRQKTTTRKTEVEKTRNMLAIARHLIALGERHHSRHSIKISPVWLGSLANQFETHLNTSRPARIVKISSEWNKEERERVMLQILSNIRRTSMRYKKKLRMEMPPLILLDWGTRLKMLLIESSKRLEHFRDEILNGNPVKYQ